MADFRLETVELDLPPLAAGLCRRLRDAGVPTTPERAAALARALTLVAPVSRRRLYWTARGVLVTDPAQVAAFDRVFAAVFGGRRAGVDVPPPEILATVVSDVPAASVRDGDEDGDERDAIDVPLAQASDGEKLATRRFDALDARELAQLHALMERLELATPPRRTRRHETGRRGPRVDLRRTLRASLRTGGDPARLRRRQRRVLPRRLVLLCDISGSMEPYARAYLQFLACAVGSGPRAEAFVFATRLTRLTRALGSRDARRALERAAATAPDWSSGTRIADALKAFNDRHGRRGMARGAVVVILSDGWERGDPAHVDREMARLARLAHRIVWVNPRLAATGFSVRAGGMAAALPHCDALVSGHSLEALGEVIAAIGGAPVSPPETPSPAQEEDWPSATPVAGSSVAMPSGHGPRRGHTTPGWSAA